MSQPLAATTIRLPEGLMAKIDARAAYFKRSRAQEIHFMLLQFLTDSTAPSVQSSPATSSEQ